MSDEKALVPIEERLVDFYGDELTAVLVQAGERRQIYVPLRPICELLGIDWSSQLQRLRRDAVLSTEIKGVVVITTPSDSSVGGGPQEMISLPLDYLNGWLFGINAARVREEIRGRLVRYQRECYRVLADAFLERSAAPAEASPAVTALMQIREMGRAIMQMAEQQIEFEQRIATTEGRLDRALNRTAVVFSEMGQRITTLEKKLAPGNPITDEQASEIQAAVHALGMMLTEQDKSKNHFQGIFNELHRRFGVTSYKLIPQGKYPAVLAFLQEWNERASR